MKQQILIVEDHPVMQESYTLLINRTRKLVVSGVAASLQEAIAQLEADTPDLVLTDISLPDGSGIDLASRLHKERPNLPVVIVTGHGDEQYRRQAINAGASGFVYKHDGPNALLEAIFAVLPEMI